MALRRHLKALEEEANQAKANKDSSAHAEGDDESNWLVSYADMMTLLCGFFIMMFSMAKLDEPQYEIVREAIAKQFGGEFKSPAQEMARFMAQFLEEKGLKTEASIDVDPSGVSVIFKSAVFFNTLSAELNPDGTKILTQLIGAVKNRQELESKQFKIVVEGYTDGRPITGGVFASNWELSSARAARVVRLFRENGFSPMHLAAIGYGDTRPQSAERSPSGEFNEESLAKNRRVVVRILEPSVSGIPFPKSPENTISPPEKSTPAADSAQPSASG